MKLNFAVSAVIAVGAGFGGVGALDTIPQLRGSVGLGNLTLSVLSQCTALQSLGNPIHYSGTGSTSGEIALQIASGANAQMVAPMSRALGAGVCNGTTAAARAGAEGMIIALDGVIVVGNSGTIGAEGIDYPGSPGDPANQWRQILRVVYTGMPTSVGTNVFARDCDSAARRAIVNNWDNVFHGVVTACTDSHPSIPGTGANGYDQNNSIVEPGIRHAFRLDDVSGATDVFLGQLGLAGINFAQGAPAGSTAVQAGVYRALANDPFCNVKRPEDKWPPVTLPAGGGESSSQIPEMRQVGVPSGAGTGLGYAPYNFSALGSPRELSPFFAENMDQDPIRRKCVGRGNNAAVALPMEQVCGADGALGVVLPIHISSQLTTAEAYPSQPCDPGLGFFPGPPPMRPSTNPVRCPNGDYPDVPGSGDFQCWLPVRADSSRPPDFVAFDCINPPGNVPVSISDNAGAAPPYTDAPDTDGRTNSDGRAYNLIVRNADGSIRTESRPDPWKTTATWVPGFIDVPMIGAFYRIHTTRSLLLPPAHTSNTCTATNSEDQIGCLTRASPCSLGYANRRAVADNPGTSAALINGVAATNPTIQALLVGGTTYPFSHSVFLNTARGFESLHASDATVPGSDAEEELSRCFATLPFNGTINVAAAPFSLVPLPAPAGFTVPQPLCQDFNGSSLCGEASNSDACVGNDGIGGGIPTSSCQNGLRDGDETGPDVCPAARPTCNPSTHHCQ